jgi:hypothetical protein
MLEKFLPAYSLDNQLIYKLGVKWDKSLLISIEGFVMSRKHLLPILLFIPAPAFANVGIPLLMYMAEWQVMFLIPIIFIEAAVLYKMIELKYWKACVATFIANLASTLLGIIVIIPTFFIDLMAPWGTASTILLIILLYPFYRLSVWCEYLVLKRKLTHPQLKQAVIIGNRLSYFMLLVFLISNIVKGYIVNGYIV